MASEHFTIIFAATVISIAFIFAYPGIEEVRHAVATSFRLSAKWVRRWLPSVAPFSWPRCRLGVVLAAFTFVALNLLPHVLTRHAPEWCDVQVMGFPFTFRSFGGFAALVYFNPLVFMVDVLVGLAAAAIAGYAFARLQWRV